MKVFGYLCLLLPSLAPAADLYFPPDGQPWQTVSPAEAGWDSAKLDAALTFAGERKSSGVVILLDGKILAERHWNLKSPRQLGADAQGHAIEDVASVQKSIVAILFGIARERWLIDIDDPVDKHLGQGWSKAPRAAEAKITLRHLLTMTSGLTTRLTLEAPAGKKWRYNTTAYSRSLQAVAKAAGKSPNGLTREWLTSLIGMADSKWEPRRGSANLLATNPLGFATTARDLARFGLLVVGEGQWNGTVVLGDREYLRQAISPSQRLNPSYGYLWWLNG
ncbi:MAG: serine hydrolase, partial [bacterium]|nr:serine hydrolase [bacterium]